MHLTDRISLLEICNREFPDGEAVEVGVAGGHFSRQILETWTSIDKLHLVDAWKHFDEGYEDECNLPQHVQDERYERILIDFGRNPKVNVVRALSTEIARLVLPESLHFVYLDANHSTKATTEDLQAWWPNIISGGILAGHDYLTGNGAGYGVKKAVDNFAAEWGLEVFKTTHEFCRKSGCYGEGWEGCSFALRKP